MISPLKPRNIGESITDLTESEKAIVNELLVHEAYAQLSPSEFMNFLGSSECEALQEAGKFARKTIVRFDKVDDLDRRTGAASLLIAKQDNDNLYKQLKAIRIKEKKLLRAIKKKNYMKAQRLAKTAQREFIKVPTLAVKLDVANAQDKK